MRSLLVIVFFAGTLVSPVPLMGQTGDRIQIPGEFIESTSPLRSGGAVTSRAIPGQGVQTFVEIAQLPVSPASGGNRSIQGATRTTSARTAYDYPAGYNNTVQSQRLPNTWLQRRTAYQISPQTRVAQANCNCAPGTVAAPPANYVPSLDIQVPGQTGAPVVQNQAVYGGNTLQLPPVTYQNNQVGSSFANWWNPIWTGSGAYQPIIRFRNMPPGTYLGQGIIGQPTAYVDGQPIRNLLRYISP